jgi:hypothetical protein
MAERQGSMAGGVFVALATVAGVVIGDVYGQASIGFLGGLAAGAAIATALWLRDRNRTGG